MRRRDTDGDQMGTDAGTRTGPAATRARTTRTRAHARGRRSKTPKKEKHLLTLIRTPMREDPAHALSWGLGAGLCQAPGSYARYLRSQPCRAVGAEPAGVGAARPPLGGGGGGTAAVPAAAGGRTVGGRCVGGREHCQWQCGWLPAARGRGRLPAAAEGLGGGRGSRRRLLPGAVASWLLGAVGRLLPSATNPRL